MKNYSDLNDYEVMYMIGEEDEIAKDMMFKKYLPIIKKEAIRLHKYGKKLGLEIEDLEQEGYCALSSSMKHYDPNKNILFYTYVSAAIKRKMGNLIRICSAGKHTFLNDSISLDEPVSEDNSNLFSFIEDKKSIKPLSELEYKELCELFNKKLYELSVDDASVLELKVNGFKTREISSLLSIDKRSINTILTRIRKKLDLVIEK